MFLNVDQVSRTPDYIVAVLDGYEVRVPFASLVVAAPVAIAGSAVVGATLTVVIAAGWRNAGGNWTRDGVAISGATGMTYTLVAADVGCVITYQSSNLPFTPAGVTVVAASATGPSPTPTPAPSPAPLPGATNPRFGYGPANPSGTASVFDPIFAAAMNLTGSATAGRAGAFSTTQSQANYTWLFVLHSAAPSGVHVSDNVGPTGFGGAASAGLFGGTDTDPITQSLPYTDSAGNVWDCYRSDGKASAYSAFTLS